jgi:hypothetical protein
VPIVVEVNRLSASKRLPASSMTFPKGRPAETRGILKLFLADRRDLTTRLRALNSNQLTIYSRRYDA